jgi:hypothetical protein
VLGQQGLAVLAILGHPLGRGAPGGGVGWNRTQHLAHVGVVAWRERRQRPSCVIAEGAYVTGVLDDLFLAGREVKVV